MPGSQVFLGYSNSNADRCSLSSVSTLEREFRSSLPEDFVDYLKKYPFKSRRVMTTIIEPDGMKHRRSIYSRSSPLGLRVMGQTSCKELSSDTPPMRPRSCSPSPSTLSSSSADGAFTAVLDIDEDRQAMDCVSMTSVVGHESPPIPALLLPVPFRKTRSPIYAPSLFRAFNMAENISSRALKRGCALFECTFDDCRGIFTDAEKLGYHIHIHLIDEDEQFCKHEQQKAQSNSKNDNSSRIKTDVLSAMNCCQSQYCVS